MEEDKKDIINDNSVDEGEEILDSLQEVDLNSSLEEAELKIKNLEQEVSELKTHNELAQDKLLRTIADGENARRRWEKNVEEAKSYSQVDIMKDLIVVMDNLDRALAHKPANIDENLANMYAGIEMTKHELESVFKKHGLETLNPLVGEKFNYNSHEAVAQIVTDEYNQDSIVSVMQPGYRIKDRLLRAAMVTVSKKS